ncbi:MAG: iron ABC transporter substrate-binding protein [Cyclonatronaceae bacterium]
MLVLLLLAGCREDAERTGTPYDQAGSPQTGSQQGGSPDSGAPHISGQHSDDSAALTVRDMLGRSVVIPAEVQRVIGLRAGALRMLTYLDAIDQVAGIEEPERRSDRPYLTAFPELRELPTIGPQMGGDPELLVSAAPDLIFLTFTSRGQADELQERTGIPVIALEYGDFSENRETFFSSLRLMAEIIGKTGRADTLIAGIRTSITELEERTSDIPDEERPRAYIGGVSYRGARGITSTEPNYPPFRFIQAVNVASDIHQRLINPIQGTYIDREQLIVWDPDVLFVDLSSLGTAGPDIRPGTPIARSLTAVRNGEVYGVLPYNNYAANYGAILANAWYAGTVLYPDRFDDITLPEKADNIFQMFFGRSIYADIQTRYGGYRQLNPEHL